MKKKKLKRWIKLITRAKNIYAEEDYRNKFVPIIKYFKKKLKKKTKRINWKRFNLSSKVGQGRRG